MREWLRLPRVATTGIGEETNVGAEDQFGDDSIGEAVRRYNTDHARPWPRSNGACPACGHDGCFGMLDGHPDRWVCFSASHESDSSGCGLRGDNCWHGDALDLDSNRAGCGRIELLRSSGYLSKDQRPTIRVRPGEGDRLVSSGVRALTGQPSLFHRAHRLVSVVTEICVGSKMGEIHRERDAPMIIDVAVPTLWALLQQSARWEKKRGSSVVACDPPDKVVRAIHAGPIWPGLRRLRGVATSPIIRVDGTIVQLPGMMR